MSRWCGTIAIVWEMVLRGFFFVETLDRFEDTPRKVLSKRAMIMKMVPWFI